MERTATVSSPRGRSALKCRLFFYVVPAVIPIVGMFVWPRPVPVWAVMECSVASIALWYAGIFAWSRLEVPKVEKLIEFFGNQTCPSCGLGIGYEAATKAQQEFSDQCDFARRSNPQARINFVRFWRHSCNQCGSELELCYESLTVQLKAEPHR